MKIIQQICSKAGRLICEAHVHLTAKFFSFHPPNVRILHESKYSDYSSLCLYKGMFHLLTGCKIYCECGKIEKIKAENRGRIEDHYLYFKKMAIWHFSTANRYLILYDVSRQIIREKKDENIDDLIERIEKIGERIYRQLSTVGYVSHILAFPPILTENYNKPIKIYNLGHLSYAIEITSSKGYRGINLARLFAMIMLKRSLVVTRDIIEKTPVTSVS